MKCDCKSYPHDDWCDYHPTNLLNLRVIELEAKCERYEADLIEIRDVKGDYDGGKTARIVSEALEQKQLSRFSG